MNITDNIFPQSKQTVFWKSEHLGLPFFNVHAQEKFFLIVAPNAATLNEWQTHLNFFLKDSENEKKIYLLPDLETLPYDHFSPHRDILSERLSILSHLPNLSRGILFCTLAGLLQRLPPVEFIRQHSLILKVGDQLSPIELRERLISSGYYLVKEVREHGEIAVRGSIIDLFPMGFHHPIRIDWLDNEIESLRLFSPETQKSLKNISELNLLPAREFPFDKKAIQTFSTTWRNTFLGNPSQCPLYEDVQNGILAQGLEYYFPLFFSGNSTTLFDYLPKNTTFVSPQNLSHSIKEYWQEINLRFEQGRHNLSHPLLPPDQLFITENIIHEHTQQLPHIILADDTSCEKSTEMNTVFPIEKETAWQTTPSLPIAEQLRNWHSTHPNQRILFCAETKGRREILLNYLKQLNIHPKPFNSWQEFLTHDELFGLIIDELTQGFYFQKKIAVLTENILFNKSTSARKNKKKSRFNPEQFIRDLSELKIGDPIVHIDHGVGRYQGLSVLSLDDVQTECICIEYADTDKLYIPIASLSRVSRYTSGDQHAPLHKLGLNHFQKAKERALKKAEDVASKLLHIHAMRAASQGHAMTFPENEYEKFISGFPFDATPDQEQAIENVIEDLKKNMPMDRVVCGDVGFGKTEVAMRAAFMVAMNAKQVAILVPTTLLAEQHYQNFRNRFADFPIRIELLSRFKTRKEQQSTCQALNEGKVDIIIGTHKLLQSEIQFKDLGLMIIDEEHRFGVKAKEHLKQLRANIHILTLTATPIPRTLHFAMAGLRELSIIATPPDRRLAVKTFLHEENKDIIIEAISRELLRGGQVYYLHNEVNSIERSAQKIREWIPEARVGIAHGQMKEQSLETVMLDFYHRRCNVLVCSTIIESGIDIATANTIIIERADKLGLAQLHQLRGRVGRSHHQAYAYLLAPPLSVLTPDAQKRLIAIAQTNDLGTGFTLATHDLEIRGTGELLGEEQSGHFHEVGYALYMEFLERAIQNLKAGANSESIQENKLLGQHCEVDCHITSLIPSDYLGDPSLRLEFYKRISACHTQKELDDLHVEMIDRFGLLPTELKQLFAESSVSRIANTLGIKKIDANKQFVRIEFHEKTSVSPQTVIRLLQMTNSKYRMDGANRLRYYYDEHLPEKRIEFLQEILMELAPKQ